VNCWSGDEFSSASGRDLPSIEETDRFAKNYHRTLRAKSMKGSTLEEIDGIGPKRRQALLKAFGSLDAIRQATVEQIAAIPGMTRKSAEELKSFL
jgi:excinuclease ABC subunit C